MNSVTLITNDIDLYNVFAGYKMFDEVNISSSIDEKAEYVYLIVSDRMCGINDLIRYAESGMKASKMVYLLSSSQSSQSGMNALAALLKSHSISVLPPKLTDSQILSRFCDIINLQERRTKNVAVLFGADSKAGTTITALSLAENLAARCEGSVALLNLSGHVAYSYLEDVEGKGLDSIRSKVFNKILSQDELKLSMVQRRELKNLYVLPPCRTLIDFKYYKTEHVEYVINLAAGMFDMVIIDAGWYPHNELYFGALNSTPNRYMITTQEEASWEAHSVIRQQALNEYGITTGRKDRSGKAEQPENIMLIVNRYKEGLGTTGSLKDYDMMFAVNLPAVDISTYQLQNQNRSLRGLNKYYDKQLDKLTNLVALQLDCKLTQVRKTRRFWR